MRARQVLRLSGLLALGVLCALPMFPEVAEAAARRFSVRVPRHAASAEVSVRSYSASCDGGMEARSYSASCDGGGGFSAPTIQYAAPASVSWWSYGTQAVPGTGQAIAAPYARPQAGYSYATAAPAPPPEGPMAVGDEWKPEPAPMPNPPAPAPLPTPQPDNREVIRNCDGTFSAPRTRASASVVGVREGRHYSETYFDKNGDGVADQAVRVRR